MKVRACVTAAVIAAGLCSAQAARAQEAVPATTGAQAPQVDIVDAARFFSAPRALGDAWERAVHAVLEGMRAFLDADLAAAQALAVAPPPKRAPAWQSALPPKPLVQPTSREARKARRLAFQPVTVEPVTQAVADVRGQRAILLGAVVELPWTVP